MCAWQLAAVVCPPGWIVTDAVCNFGQRFAIIPRDSVGAPNDALLADLEKSLDNITLQIKALTEEQQRLVGMIRKVGTGHSGVQSYNEAVRGRFQ